jgi:hypothetical protein
MARPAPTPPDVEAALRDARDRLRYEKKHGFLDADYNGDPDPDVDLALEALARLPGMALSEDVRAYLDRLVRADLEGPLRRERGRPRNMGRDFWIVYVVARIAERHGLRPTQNREPAHNKSVDCPSACAIVAQALQELGIDCGVRGVEEIWRRRDHIRASCK